MPDISTMRVFDRPTTSSSFRPPTSPTSAPDETPISAAEEDGAAHGGQSAAKVEPSMDGNAAESGPAPHVSNGGGGGGGGAVRAPEQQPQPQPGYFNGQSAAPYSYGQPPPMMQVMPDGRMMYAMPMMQQRGYGPGDGGYPPPNVGMYPGMPGSMAAPHGYSQGGPQGGYPQDLGHPPPGHHQGGQQGGYLQQGGPPSGYPQGQPSGYPQGQPNYPASAGGYPPPAEGHGTGYPQQQGPAGGYPQSGGMPSASPASGQMMSGQQQSMGMPGQPQSVGSGQMVAVHQQPVGSGQNQAMGAGQMVSGQHQPIRSQTMPPGQTLSPGHTAPQAQVAAGQPMSAAQMQYAPDPRVSAWGYGGGQSGPPEGGWAPQYGQPGGPMAASGIPSGMMQVRGPYGEPQWVPSQPAAEPSSDASSGPLPGPGQAGGAARAAAHPDGSAQYAPPPHGNFMYMGQPPEQRPKEAPPVDTHRTGGFYIFPCPVCSRGCKTKAGLEKHLRASCGDKLEGGVAPTTVPIFLPIANWTCEWCKIPADSAKGFGEGPSGPVALCSRCTVFWKAGMPKVPIAGPDDMFQCDICSQRFKSARGLCNHWKHCNTEGRWKCEWCSEQKGRRGPGPGGGTSLCNLCTSRWKAGFTSQPEINAETNTYNCEACGMRFDAVRSLVAHQRYCSGGNWACRWCDMKEGEHLKGKGPGPDGPSTLCSVCASRFRSGYKKPPTIDADGKAVCDGCGLKFDSVRGLGSHIRGCTGGTWRCEWCAADEKQSRGKSPGPNGPRTLCSKCGSRFRNGQKARIERDDEGRLICDRCHKTFDSLIRLSGHKRFCDGGTWRCEWCDVDDGDAGGKGQGPTGPRTLCSICASRFRGGHTAPPPRDSDGRFFCEDCEKRFDTVSGLGSHRRFCTREVPNLKKGDLVEDLRLGGGFVALPENAPPLAHEFVGDALQIWCALSFLAKCCEVDRIVDWDEFLAVLGKDQETAARSAVLHNLHAFLVGMLYDHLYRQTKGFVAGGGVFDGRVLNGFTWQELLRQYLQMLAGERQIKLDLGGMSEFGSAADMLGTYEYEELSLRQRLDLLLLLTNQAAQTRTARDYMDKQMSEMGKARTAKRTEYTAARKKIYQSTKSSESAPKRAKTEPEDPTMSPTSTSVAGDDAGSAQNDDAPASEDVDAMDMPTDVTHATTTDEDEVGMVLDTVVAGDPTATEVPEFESESDVVPAPEIDDSATSPVKHDQKPKSDDAMNNPDAEPMKMADARSAHPDAASGMDDADSEMSPWNNGTLSAAGDSIDPMRSFSAASYSSLTSSADAPQRTMSEKRKRGHGAGQSGEERQTRRMAEAVAREDINFRFQGVNDDLQSFRRDPLGFDRNYNSYWVLEGSYDKVWVQELSGTATERWTVIQTSRDLNVLVDSLHKQGQRESVLRANIIDRKKRFIDAMGGEPDPTPEAEGDDKLVASPVKAEPRSQEEVCGEETAAPGPADGTSVAETRPNADQVASSAKGADSNGSTDAGGGGAAVVDTDGDDDSAAGESGTVHVRALKSPPKSGAPTDGGAGDGLRRERRVANKCTDYAEVDDVADDAVDDATPDSPDVPSVATAENGGGAAEEEPVTVEEVATRDNAPIFVSNAVKCILAEQGAADWRCGFCQEAFTDDGSQHHCQICHSTFEARTMPDKKFESHVAACQRALEKGETAWLTQVGEELPFSAMCIKSELLDMNDALTPKSVKDWNDQERVKWVMEVKTARRPTDLEHCLLELISNVDVKWLDKEWRPWVELRAYIDKKQGERDVQKKSPIKGEIAPQPVVESSDADEFSTPAVAVAEEVAATTDSAPTVTAAEEAEAAVVEQTTRDIIEFTYARVEESQPLEGEQDEFYSPSPPPSDTEEDDIAELKSDSPPMASPSRDATDGDGAVANDTPAITADGGAAATTTPSAVSDDAVPTEDPTTRTLEHRDPLVQREDSTPTSEVSPALGEQRSDAAVSPTEAGPTSDNEVVAASIAAVGGPNEVAREGAADSSAALNGTETDEHQPMQVEIPSVPLQPTEATIPAAKQPDVMAAGEHAVVEEGITTQSEPEVASGRSDVGGATGTLNAVVIVVAENTSPTPTTTIPDTAIDVISNPLVDDGAAPGSRPDAVIEEAESVAAAAEANSATGGSGLAATAPPAASELVEGDAVPGLPLVAPVAQDTRGAAAAAGTASAIDSDQHATSPPAASQLVEGDAVPGSPLVAPVTHAAAGTASAIDSDQHATSPPAASQLVEGDAAAGPGPATPIATDESGAAGATRMSLTPPRPHKARMAKQQYRSSFGPYAPGFQRPPESVAWAPGIPTNSGPCMLWLAVFDAAATYGAQGKPKNLKRKFDTSMYSNTVLERPVTRPPKQNKQKKH